jgi:hypothetical protein
VQPAGVQQHERTKCLHLALDVDFRKRMLAGTVDLTVEVMECGAASFDLDTHPRAHNQGRNLLQITQVDADKPTAWDL